jgi:hypothetical protein
LLRRCHNKRCCKSLLLPLVMKPPDLMVASWQFVFFRFDFASTKKDDPQITRSADMNK